MTTTRAGPGIDLLVVARDESEVLGDTIPRLASCLSPSDRLHLVADHCRDATVAETSAVGLRVHVRGPEHGPPGKGPAIAWWLGRTRRGEAGRRAVVVVDADSLPAASFLEPLRRRLGRGEVAIQLRIEPEADACSAMTRLAAFSDVVEQQVFDAWRARLGWPVRLRGTGMAFARDVLEGVAPFLGTVAEDIELTLLLAARGTPITLALETFVRDPKPLDSGGIVRQRARWLRGQFQVLRRHPRSAAQLLLRGPSGWSLLISAFARPKALSVPLALAASVGCALVWWRHAGWAWLAFSAVAALVVATELAALLVGLRHVRDRGRVLRALLTSPVFVLLWLRSAVLSVTSREDWLRVRPRRPPGPDRGQG